LWPADMPAVRSSPCMLLSVVVPQQALQQEGRGGGVRAPFFCWACRRGERCHKEWSEVWPSPTRCRVASTPSSERGNPPSPSATTPCTTSPPPAHRRVRSPRPPPSPFGSYSTEPAISIFRRAGAVAQQGHLQCLGHASSKPPNVSFSSVSATKRHLTAPTGSSARSSHAVRLTSLGPAFFITPTAEQRGHLRCPGHGPFTPLNTLPPSGSAMTQ